MIMNDPRSCQRYVATFYVFLEICFVIEFFFFFFFPLLTYTFVLVVALADEKRECRLRRYYERMLGTKAGRQTRHGHGRAKTGVLVHKEIWKCEERYQSLRVNLAAS